MRTASAQALESGRNTLDASLLGDHSAERVAEELFALADVLKEEGSLRRSLSDPSRTAEDKQSLADHLLDGKVLAPTQAVMKTLVAARWSTEKDLIRALQELGVDALIEMARQADQLVEVQHELGLIRNLLRENRDLRIALSPASQLDAEQRVALVGKVLAGKATASTLHLVSRLVSHPQHASTVAALDQVASRVAHARQKRLVRVTSATPLSEEQLQRLHSVLSKKYGPVSINTAVNPDFIGGLRVRVGSDAIDGTLQASIAGVKQRLGV
ncbi:F0F1 ATP synthase subunit delta [Boudabousia marimammalium]|uniref:ATP synthase subunit delta n=1 Tax=Boudabousia marimammalium TaxID=156892 RepID=A0A1Q5PRF7_9ACTO|nr:F0F1 ATP synthase subunit delta [Boudabousia marimammalium]OKL50164.1 ATP synthase F1 subunit delta [Boudabousia marimammalium]